MHDHTAEQPPTEWMWDAPFWDERYRSSERIWSGNPNPQLVREVADLTPGTALDAGCGEGGDSHWLARHGWQVTAMDVSTVALERGAAHAGAEIADRIVWEQADFTSWVPDGRAYDLVSAQFMHFPLAVREPLFAQLAASVAPGGALLIVGHDVSDLDSGMPRHGEPDMFFTPEQVAAGLDPASWEIVTSATRPRPATNPDGDDVIVADAVLHARRRR